MSTPVSFGTLLLITKDAIDYLEAHDILETDGTFKDPNIAQDTEFLAAVVASATRHGITVQRDVLRVVRALPAILLALGIEAPPDVPAV